MKVTNIHTIGVELERFSITFSMLQAAVIESQSDGK